MHFQQEEEENLYICTASHQELILGSLGDLDLFLYDSSHVVNAAW